MNTEEKELTILDFLPKILPVLDVIFIVWIAILSPNPWITTPVQLGIPALGMISIILFRDKGRLGFYMIGLFSSIPLFILNCWASPDCPTWINEFTFIAGGLMMTTYSWEPIVVLGFVLCTTIIPMTIYNNTWQYTGTVVIGEIAVWFLMERCIKFVNVQKKQVEAQKQLIEEKNKEIIDSINYAKRIQRAQMPTEKQVERTLNRLRNQK